MRLSANEQAALQQEHRLFWSVTYGILVQVRVAVFKSTVLLLAVEGSGLVGEVVHVDFRTGLGAGAQVVDRQVEGAALVVPAVADGDVVGAGPVEPDGVEGAEVRAAVAVCGSGQVDPVVPVDAVQVGVRERQSLCPWQFVFGVALAADFDLVAAAGSEIGDVPILVVLGLLCAPALGPRSARNPRRRCRGGAAPYRQ